MIAGIEILRPINGLMALIGFVIGAVLSGFPLGPIPIQLLVGALVVFLQTGAGMTLNDYYDWRIDRINRPYRVIPSGRMTLEMAMNYAIFLFGVSIGLSFFFLPLPVTALVLLNTGLSALYSWKLKRTPLGHIAVSWLAASVFIMATLLLNEFTYVALILFSLVFCGNMARELTKGVEDYKGDKAKGARTLAVTLGRDVASWLAITFSFLTIAIIPLPYIFDYVGLGYAILGALAAAVVVYSGFLMLQNKPGKSQLVLKAAMGILILGLVIGMLF